MLQTKLIAKIKTDILCSVPFFRKSCHLWENMEKYCRARQATWQYGACALHAGYISLQIYTPRLCNTHCFSTATMVERTRLNFTLYVHCLSCLRMEVFQIIYKLFCWHVWRNFFIPKKMFMCEQNCILRRFDVPYVIVLFITTNVQH
jgi:hypothetical protein